MVPLVFFLAIGILHLLMTIATRFLPRAEAEPGRRGGARDAAAGGEAACAEAPARALRHAPGPGARSPGIRR
jgi:hypothetical protein